MCFSRIFLGVFLLLAFAVSPALRADDTAVVKAALERSYAAMADAGPFRVTSEVEGDAGSTASTIDVDWPDRFHIRNAAGSGMEVIAVPSGAYMRQGEQWMRLPVDMQVLTRIWSEQGMRDALASISDGRLLGEAAIGGRNARVYGYTGSLTVMGISSESTSKVWIDAENDLPLRIEVDGQAMGQRSVTLNIYDWNAEIDIRAPN